MRTKAWKRVHLSILLSEMHKKRACIPQRNAGS